MKKVKYQTPEIKVFKLKNNPTLLSASCPEEGGGGGGGF